MTGDRLRTQLVRTVLLIGMLCVPGSAQPPERPSEERPPEDKFLNSCASARRKLVSVALWDRDRGHVGEVPIWRLPETDLFFFISGMTIDADGAPNAYNLNDTGLDELANAGSPNHWDGIVTDQYGSPLIQQEEDPFPGYYISCTSLADQTKEISDTGRYVDATTIPFAALPAEIAERAGVHLEDFAFVVNLRSGKSSFAIYADIGSIGEGSVALAATLGISSNARHGGESDGVLYIFFPGSGTMKPRSIGEIKSEGERLFSDSAALRRCISMVGDPDRGNPESADSGDTPRPPTWPEEVGSDR